MADTKQQLMVDVNSFEQFFVPVQVLLETHMGDGDAVQLTREIVLKLGGSLPLTREQRIAHLIDAGHSMSRYAPCSNCGDLDGCHNWAL